MSYSGFALLISGEGGIRTPGGVTLNGFQDRRNRPLCHLSKAYHELLSPSVCECKVITFFPFLQIFPQLFYNLFSIYF